MSDHFPYDPARRDFLTASLTLAAGLAMGQSATAKQLEPDMPMPNAKPAEPKFKVAMLVYPRMVLLDLVGPQTVLKILGSEIVLVGKTLAPVSTDVAIDVTPDVVFTDCLDNLDVLFVPGGLMGSLAAMEDEATLQFLARAGRTARYVTSVCTGGLVLAAAGLLNGYRATAHWGVAGLLPLMGAAYDNSRVVHDRNRLTGGGVTAGIDFALTLATLLRGEAAARHIQLVLEYSPQPPFRSGTPSEVGPEQMVEERRQRVGMDEQARKAAERAGARLGIAGSAS